VHTVAVADLPALETTVLGPGPWHEVSQQQVNLFADATGDHQWIHVDPERAATGPFGQTIAHGYLTLSLVPALLDELLQVHDAAQAINYGLGKARFPAPVPVGSRARLTAVVEKVEPVPSGFQVTLAVTIDCDAGPKPACVAQVLYRFFGPTEPTAGGGASCSAMARSSAATIVAVSASSLVKTTLPL
jgi:acyl dehydratase